MDIENITKDLLLNGSPLPSLLKFGISKSVAAYMNDTQEAENFTMFYDKLRELTYEDNEFLDKAEKNEEYYILLVTAIENPQIPTLVSLIDEIYLDESETVIQDMFITLSAILTPTIFVTLICEFYIEHIKLEWDENTYNLMAIFNSCFNHSSIEKMFWDVLYFYKFNGGEIITPEQKNLIERMMLAIMELNSKRYLLCSEYGYKDDDIIDVDEYIGMVRSGVWGNDDCIYDSSITHRYINVYDT